MTNQATTTKEALEPPELEPCPFCGGQAKSSPTTDGEGGVYVDRWAINCRACNFEMIEMATEGDKPFYATALRTLTTRWNSRVTAPIVAPDGISWTALLSVLERLRSKNRNPDNEWYHGWNAAIQCLINDINGRRRSVPASPVAPISKDAWSTWFDRLGDKASAEVVNATADLVTDERLAALVQAGVLPSPVAIRDEAEDFARRVVGTEFDNTAASHETLKQTMIERIADSVTPPSTAAKAAAEEIDKLLVPLREYAKTPGINQIAAIIERCFSAEREDQKSTPRGSIK